MAKENTKQRVIKQMETLLEQLESNYDVQKLTEAQQLFNDMLNLIKENDASVFNALIAIKLLDNYLTKDFLDKHLTQPKEEKKEVKEGK